MAWSTSGPRPQRSKVPGRKDSMSTSASLTSSLSSSAPSGSPKSMDTSRLLRPTNAHHSETPSFCQPSVRRASPLGCSTLMTSAPKSARSVPMTGPANRTAASMTLRPASGPGGEASWSVTGSRLLRCGHASGGRRARQRGGSVSGIGQSIVNAADGGTPCRLPARRATPCAVTQRRRGRGTAGGPLGQVPDRPYASTRTGSTG